MKSYFQAKDIQKILSITKIRYEYLGSKISITPDVHEVEGTGRSHIYSFRNLIEFAIAHNGNKLGLSMKSVIKIIEMLKGMELGLGVDIFGWEFGKEPQDDIRIYYVYYGELAEILIWSDFINTSTELGNLIEKYFEQAENVSEDDESVLTEQLKRATDSANTVYEKISKLVNLSIKYKDSSNKSQLVGMFRQLLNESDGYVTINATTIRRKIVDILKAQ